MSAHEALIDLGTRLDDLEDHAAKLAVDTDVQSLAHLLWDIRGTRQQLALRERAVEDLLAGLLGHDVIEVPGLPPIQKRGGTDRKSWDWDGLLPVLLRRHLDPEGTGEVDPAVVEAAATFATKVLGVTPSKGPKITAVKGLGLDPDEWCQTTPGRATVQFHAEAVRS